MVILRTTLVMMLVDLFLWYSIGNITESFKCLAEPVNLLICISQKLISCGFGIKPSLIVQIKSGTVLVKTLRNKSY